MRAQPRPAGQQALSHRLQAGLRSSLTAAEAATTAAADGAAAGAAAVLGSTARPITATAMALTLTLIIAAMVMAMAADGDIATGTAITEVIGIMAMGIMVMDTMAMDITAPAAAGITTTATNKQFDISKRPLNWGRFPLRLSIPIPDIRQGRG